VPPGPEASGIRQPRNWADESLETHEHGDADWHSGEYREPERDAGNLYFATMGGMQQAVSERNYEEAAYLAKRNLRQLAPWLEEDRRSGYGHGPPPSIPALSTGGTMLALTGDVEGLEEMRRLVHGTKELADWQETVEGHFDDLATFQQILKAVEDNPGCLQSEIKTMIGAEDGRRVATLISWLEKAGRLVRVKEKKSYRLALAGVAIPGVETAPPSPPAAPIRSHRAGRRALAPREVDLGSLHIVPLPPSPPRWEERGRIAPVLPPSEGFFEITDTADWQLAGVTSIPVLERPDPAYRLLYAMDDGLLLLDDLGNAEGVRAPASALLYDRRGRELARAPLRHDLYRREVNPLGHGFIAMSGVGIVHAYDEYLNPLFETSLRDAPEVRALEQRLEADEVDLKRLVRSVALSPDNRTYLVTAVDEAWCIDLAGEGVWALKMPVREGWTRVTDRGESVATSVEVDEALATLGLTLPVTPDQVKKQYRALAKQYHPDVNRSPGADEQMKAISHAAAVLTGLDESHLAASVGVTYRRAGQTFSTEIEGVTVAFDLSYEVGEMQAADWIYASGFGPGGVTYLASYSGRVVVVDADGHPQTAYDLGSVPRRIADSGDFLYFLTDTRLYVLRGDALYALIDTLEASSLIVGRSGFGLLETKRFRWFREDGLLLGSVISKDPIRRVYRTENHLVLETRTRRAMITGAPDWWES
jgi:DnaJ-domain-containing protein 1